MTSPGSQPDTTVVREITAAEFMAQLPVLLAIYATAMSYPLEVAAERAPVWRSHATREGFRCVTAAIEQTVVGFSYGYTGKAGQWWHGEVARGLGSYQHPHLANYFELTELHVLPEVQARGIGHTLLQHLLTPVRAHHVMLSTPEGPTRAWRLYRRLGFTDVLRYFLFTGDPRPFAVLSHELPLGDAESAP